MLPVTLIADVVRSVLPLLVTINVALEVSGTESVPKGMALELNETAGVYTPVPVKLSVTALAAPATVREPVVVLVSFGE
jgi:hypothetical protein